MLVIATNAATTDINDNINTTVTTAFRATAKLRDLSFGLRLWLWWMLLSVPRMLYGDPQLPFHIAEEYKGA